MLCGNRNITFSRYAHAVADGSINQVALNVQHHSCCYLHAAFRGFSLLAVCQGTDYIIFTNVLGSARFSHLTGCFGILVDNLVGLALFFSVRFGLT